MTRNELNRTWADTLAVRERRAWRAGFAAGALFVAATGALLGLMTIAL